MDYVLHEVLEVQELATFKTICLTKSKTMRALVSDPILKDMMMQDVDISTRQLQEFSSILSKAKEMEGFGRNVQ
jgi:similar to spore coat protein